MSNYVKSTDFAAKDALASGNASKIVKGTEIDTEFNNIATAVATKADLASPTFTGTPTMPTGTIAVTQSFGNNTTALATTAFVQAALSAMSCTQSALFIPTQPAAQTPARCLALVHGPHLVLVALWWVWMLAMRYLIRLKRRADPLMHCNVSHTHTAFPDPGHTHTYRSCHKTSSFTGGWRNYSA
jgi:hypothetical protein